MAWPSFRPWPGAVRDSLATDRGAIVISIAHQHYRDPTSWPARPRDIGEARARRGAAQTVRLGGARRGGGARG